MAKRIEAASALSLSPVTLVVLAAGGVRVPARTGSVPIDLDLIHLETLLALASPGGTTRDALLTDLASEPGDADRINDFVAQLESDELLIEPRPDGPRTPSAVRSSRRPD